MRYVIVALLLAVFGQSSAQQSLPEWAHMHRKNAGVLLDGWVVATSTEGRFTVKIPCKFNDSTMDLRGREGSVEKTFVLGCKRDDQHTYSVSRATYKGGEADAKKTFLKSKYPSMQGIQLRMQSSFNGYEGIYTEIKDKVSCAYMKNILIDESMVLIMAEAPISECQKLRDNLPTFFSSLRVGPL